MRVEQVEIEEVSGAVAGVLSAAERVTERRGLLLRVTTTDGICGLGEAAPLPGYSPDTIEAARDALTGIDWKDLPEPEELIRDGDLLARLRAIGDRARVPSARFALETAFLDIAGHRTSRPIWKLLAGADRAGTEVPLTAFVGAVDDSNLEDAARRAVERGARGVKVKVTGPLSAARIDRILAVRRGIGNVPLRLDANGSLSAASIHEELQRLRSAKIEFIEEPVPASSLEAVTDLPVPMALDESLQNERNWTLAEPHLARLSCVAFVLKPMTLGGFSASLDWLERARAHRLEATISHSFDGPVALTACAHLAVAVASRRFGSGLEPHGGLRAWATVALPLHASGHLVSHGQPGLGIAPETMSSS